MLFYNEISVLQMMSCHRRQLIIISTGAACRGIEGAKSQGAEMSMSVSMSKTFIGGAICREFESEAPAAEEMLD